MMKVTVLGAGNWGTTLSIKLSFNKKEVALWGRQKEIDEIKTTGVNKTYLPGINVPSIIKVTADIEEALAFSPNLLIFAVPSKVLRAVAKKVGKIGLKSNIILLSVVKGIEEGTLKRMSEILAEEIKCDSSQICVLSGPTIASEVIKGMPTTAVCASESKDTAEFIQTALMNMSFRIYTSQDVIGVELGGALKNVIAIASGVIDGLGLGANSKGALIARGLAEITRLGLKMGADPLTFAGLSGIGDIVTTSISGYSRNRFVGEQIGKGKKLDEILSSMVMVAEGVSTTKSAYELSKKYDVTMPITYEMYKVLFEGKSPKDAIASLMGREPKPEMY
ncbi:MAG TPA: NAD(P)-dependent glycerol-3-phosphate dehydrogenase [bacterium (Candidatus Stahlbacteria)]|nr:NAD(P)-dependent glycerol-3-phosphate dehydrogenase [Candidatus Stahlbacteria bacterium]